MSTDTKPDYKPSPTQINAALLVFLAMKHLEMVKPIVTSYRNAILAEGQWRIDKEKGGQGDTLVTDHKDSFLMSDDDFATYDALCKQMRDKAGLPVEDPEHCPLLVAEDLLLQTKQLLVSEMEPVTHIGWEMLTQHKTQPMEEYIELTLNMLGSACQGTLASPQQHWLLVWRDHVRGGRAVTCGFESDLNTCSRPGYTGRVVMDCVRCKSGTQQNRFAWLSHRLTVLTRISLKEAA
ncbi:hypothetical protein os4_36670 (plasmid) [Comamonadaceae bacterium OS-4]|nr:hypothetical protein os4_36670 [Comamonadaceae bacterium OS-4]